MNKLVLEHDVLSRHSTILLVGNILGYLDHTFFGYVKLLLLLDGAYKIHGHLIYHDEPEEFLHVLLGISFWYSLPLKKRMASSIRIFYEYVFLLYLKVIHNYK